MSAMQFVRLFLQYYVMHDGHDVHMHDMAQHAWQLLDAEDQKCMLQWQRQYKRQQLNWQR